MKLIEAVIYGFGKFYQKTISFQDGIHVIYGPNEAGKSTLHSFLGCMLFGLERGRGRAARGDLYSRYLPWDHDATYGGSLTLETDEQVFQIQRSFRSDHKTCLLSSQRQRPSACTDEILAGLGQMYVCDSRFQANLDKHGEGTAQLMSDAIAIYCKK